MPENLETKTSLKRDHGKYELPEITQDITCTICGEKKMKMSRTVYKMPDGEDTLIILLECENCNYRKSDLVSLYTAFKPGEYQLLVDDGDFTHKIFRGSSGELEIPEIGITIERGTSAIYEFTNIERILLKMQEQTEFYLNNTPHDTNEWINAHEALKRVKKCLSGEIPFQVILRDHDGGSYITPSKKEKMNFIPYQNK